MPVVGPDASRMRLLPTAPVLTQPEPHRPRRQPLRAVSAERGTSAGLLRSPVRLSWAGVRVSSGRKARAHAFGDCAPKTLAPNLRGIRPEVQHFARKPPELLPTSPITGRTVNAADPTTLPAPPWQRLASWNWLSPTRARHRAYRSRSAGHRSARGESARCRATALGKPPARSPHTDRGPRAHSRPPARARAS